MTKRPPRRQVRLVMEEPYREGGRARLFSYGYRALAALAMCNERTVRNAVKAGQLDCDSLADVVRWLNSRQFSRRTGRMIVRAPKFEAAEGGATCALDVLRANATAAGRK